MTEKRSIWPLLRRGLYLCLFVFGLWGYIYSYTQPTQQAVITSVGTVTSRSHRPRHGSSYTTYHCRVGIEMIENGETVRGEVEVAYRTRWSPPKRGMSLEVGRNPLGELVAIPDLKLREITLFMWVIGGVFLIGSWLAAKGQSEKEQENIRTSGSAVPGEKENGEDAEENLPGTLRRLKKDGYCWNGKLGEDYVKRQADQVVKIMGVVCLCILLAAFAISGGGGQIEFMLVMLATDAMLMGVAFLIRWLMPRMSGNRTMYYEMREDGIVIGSGKSSIYFPWERIRKIRDQGEYLEIAGKIRKERIYASDEEKPFIREYIDLHLLSGRIV